LPRARPAIRWSSFIISLGVQSLQRGGVEAAPFYEWGGKNEDQSDGFAARRPGWKMPIHQLLTTYGVNAVFHGHDHLYAMQELDGIVTRRRRNRA
jgi:hypothetical protein